MELYVMAYSNVAATFRLRTTIRRRTKNLSNIRKLENKVSTYYTGSLLDLTCFRIG